MSYEQRPPFEYLNFVQLLGSISKMDQSRLLTLIDPLVYENGRLSEKFQDITKHRMRYVHEDSIEALKIYLAQPHNNEFIVKVFSVTTVPHINLENPYLHQTTATIQYTLEYRPNEEKPFIFIAKQNPNERFPASKTDLIDWLTLSESCNRIRDKLESGHIKAVYKNTSIHSIDQLTWSEEKNWSRLLVDGKFYHMQTNSPAAKTVFFEKESVNKVCAEFIELGNKQEFRNTENKDEETPLDYLKKLETKFSTMRAAQQLTIAAFALIENPTKCTFTRQGRANERVSKNLIIDDINELAKTLNFQIVKGQSEIANAPKNKREDTYVSEADLNAIATLVRHLGQQNGGK